MYLTKVGIENLKHRNLALLVDEYKINIDLACRNNNTK